MVDFTTGECTSHRSINHCQLAVTRDCTPRKLLKGLDKFCGEKVDEDEEEEEEEEEERVEKF